MNDSILVSSCLLGFPSRYDGSDNHLPRVDDFLRTHRLTAIPFCPEQLAGLPTPRPNCWFSRGTGIDILDGGGQLVDETGFDVSQIFLHGARLALRIAQMTGCRQALLKQRSPSCGTCQVHQNGILVDGIGVTAALLARHGLSLHSEEEL